MKIRLFLPAGGGLAYTEIPKCASSTVKQYLFAAASGGFLDGDIHRMRCDELLRWKWDRLEIRLRLFMRRHHHFTFVRNPYARLVSAFYDKVVNRQPDGAMFGREALRRAIAAYGVDPRLDPVEGFRRFLVLVRDSVLFAGPVEADPHWQPMAWIAAAPMRLGVDYDDVLHVETIAADLRRLLIEHYPERASEWEEIRTFNEGRSDGIRRTVSVADHFDATSRLLVEQTFQDDFECFGYSLDPAVATARPMEISETNARLAEVLRRGGRRLVH